MRLNSGDDKQRSLGKDKRFFLRAGAIFALFLGFNLASSKARASDENSIFQFHGRVGTISSSYSGPQIGTGNFNLPNGVDLETEYFINNHRSFILRTTLGIDQKASTNRYSYTGLGERFYFLSRGVQEEFSSEGTIIKTSPTWRFYTGVDAGVSQVLVVQLNSILGTYASLIEASACVGAIYQITNDIGVEAHLGYGFGVGYTDVSATMSTMQMFLGLTFYL